MRGQTFYGWLQQETVSGRVAILKLYEEKDRLLYAEAPKIRRQYMQLLGDEEERVLQAELEASLLEEKVAMIQAAINRNEKIDLAAIDAKLEEIRQRQIAEVEKADRTLSELPELTQEQIDTMQRQYREITSHFHPAMNPDVTDVQKDLYEKAVKAYQMQNAEEMNLIYQMLFAPVDMGSLVVTMGEVDSSGERSRGEYQRIAGSLSTDYKLAKELYECFIPLEEDAVFIDTLKQYEKQRSQLEAEISQIRSGFPFNARSTLNDPSKTEEYRDELKIRLRQALRRKEELEKRIDSMLEGHVHA